MTRQRPWIAAGAALLVVGAASLGVADGAAREDAGESREDAGECGPAIEAREQRLAEPVTSGSPTITVLGDSYTRGTGLSGPEVAWPTALGERLGAEVVVDGVGATGYTTPGFCMTAPFRYGQRLDSDPPEGDVVVVQGSVNDSLLGTPDEVGAAAADVLEQLEDVPTVVVVGPPRVPAADEAELAVIDAALREATDEAGRVYVPLMDADIELLDDDLHPTEAGQQRIAELVAAAIETAD
ncbi:SGNH/GDSL hydrolase family protein [Blastococcus sp. SYSU DS0617]